MYPTVQLDSINMIVRAIIDNADTIAARITPIMILVFARDTVQQDMLTQLPIHVQVLAPRDITKLHETSRLTIKILYKAYALPN